MPLLPAGVLLWSPRRRRVRAAALCPGLLPSRRRRSAQLVHRTVPRVAITVHKHNEHENDSGDERGDREGTGDDPEECGDPDEMPCRSTLDGVCIDKASQGATKLRGRMLTSGDVNVLLGEAVGSAPAEVQADETLGKISTSGTGKEAWSVEEGKPWILDGDGPWILDEDRPWTLDREGPWTSYGEGPWTDGEGNTQLPDCLCSAECRSVWALTLDNPVDRSRDEESADSGAHLSPGPDSPSSSGADQSREKRLHEPTNKRPACDSAPTSELAAQKGTPDNPLVAALTARQLWSSDDIDGAALQVSPATGDLLARIATVWQADLEERLHLDRCGGDSGRSESELSSPESASLDGERRLRLGICC